MVEDAVEDYARARGIYELAVQQELDMPEIVWKAYIDFEIERGERERARELYERLLERTSHVKVYISYALMEAAAFDGGEDEDGNQLEDQPGDVDSARAVFERGYKELRRSGEKEDVSGWLLYEHRMILTAQRALLLEAWKRFEEENGTEEDQQKVQDMMPTTRKRWRKAEDGSGQLEEYWDLAFPDDEREANPASYNFFRAAQEWAAQRGAEASAGGGLSYDMSDSDSDDDEEDGAGANGADGEAAVKEAESGDGGEVEQAMDQD